jgi:hypothetical protein
MAAKYDESSGDGSAWSHYETGRNTFPIEIANQLTLHYGLDIGWIYQDRLDQLNPRLNEIIQRGETLIANNLRGRRRRARAAKDWTA